MNVSTVAREVRGELAPALPTCIYFEVTNRCNLPCRTCLRTFHTVEPAADLSLAEIRRVADQVPSLRRAVLQGIGEPLLNRELPEIVADLAGRGVSVVFNTNGTLLSPEWADRLIDGGLDELRVSLDAAHPETFEAIRGADLLPQIVERVRQFIARRRERGSSKPRVALWLIGLRANVAELPELVDIAADVGAEEVYLHRVTFREGDDAFGVASRGESAFVAYDSEEEHALVEARTRAAAKGIAFRGSGAMDPVACYGERTSSDRPWSACQRPWTLLYVTANGNLLPCCIAPFVDPNYREITLGNVRETSIADLWNGAGYRTFRRRFLSPDPVNCCRGCGTNWSL
ncbi:MAG: radical SAM protein [Planctomycetes bacterium]|nr:radical SAM protein [Planctomycetota bacterium]MBI3844082.1 radical SAM protein [Planctomycetota bacterium]